MGTGNAGEGTEWVQRREGREREGKERKEKDGRERREERRNEHHEECVTKGIREG